MVRLEDRVRDLVAAGLSPADRHDCLVLMLHAAMCSHGFRQPEMNVISGMLSKRGGAYPLQTFDHQGEQAKLRLLPLFGQLVCYVDYQGSVHQLNLRTEDFVHDKGTVMTRTHEHMPLEGFTLSVFALEQKFRVLLLAHIFPERQTPQLSSLGDHAQKRMMHFLDVSSLLALGSTSKAFLQVSKDPGIWCRLCYADFASVTGNGMSGHRSWRCDKSHGKCAHDTRQQYIRL